jgi:hypothetical protein
LVKCETSEKAIQKCDSFSKQNPKNGYHHQKNHIESDKKIARNLAKPIKFVAYQKVRKIWIISKKKS